MSFHSARIDAAPRGRAFISICILHPRADVISPSSSHLLGSQEGSAPRRHAGPCNRFPRRQCRWGFHYVCGSDWIRLATLGKLEVYTVNKSLQLVQRIITRMKERKYGRSAPEAQPAVSGNLCFYSPTLSMIQLFYCFLLFSTYLRVIISP